MKDREYRCSQCLVLQDKEMEYPYVCDVCEQIEDISKEEVVCERKILQTPDYMTLLIDPSGLYPRDKKQVKSHKDIINWLRGIK